MNNAKTKKQKTNLSTHPSLISAGVGVLFFVLVFTIMAVVVAPKQHDLAVGDISPVTFIANKNIEDTVTYRQKIDESIAAVEKHSVEDDAVVETSMNDLRELLNRASDVRAEYEPIFSPYRGQADFVEIVDLFFENPIILEQLRERIGLPLDDTALKDMLRATSSEFTNMRLSLTTEFSTIYNRGVEETTMASSKASVMQSIRRTVGNTSALLPLAQTIVDEVLTINLAVDEARYEREVEEAKSSVELPMFLKGQNIVRENDPITEAQHQVLLELGYLRERVDISMYIGLAAIVSLLCLVMALFVIVFEPDMLKKPMQIVLLCTICLLHVGLASVAVQFNQYIIPLQFGVMLISILIKPRLAMVVNFVLTVLVGIIASGSSGLLSMTTSSILIVGLVGGCQAVYLTRRPLQRAGLFLVGIATGLIDMAVLLALGLMTTSNVNEMLISSLLAAVGGLLSGILAISLMPIFESAFHLLTPPKLLELSNPHQPLLKRLLLEAPGTYHHAIMVANLAEAAVESVGGNALLTRVAAYYHDVGKLKRPYFFGENQLGGENPHDRMEPLVSSATLTAHTTDGAKLAEAARLPQPIVDIIKQHHGTSATQYFYIKAVAQEGEENVDIADFRYEGPAPQTKEAAIIMLADIAEAGVRSLKQRSGEEIDTFIHKLIKNKLDDGQLDHTPLTLRDLELIAQAFIKVLIGMYHERVAYPDIEVIKHAQRN